MWLGTLNNGQIVSEKPNTRKRIGLCCEFTQPRDHSFAQPCILLLSSIGAPSHYQSDTMRCVLPARRPPDDVRICLARRHGTAVVCLCMHCVVIGLNMSKVIMSRSVGRSRPSFLNIIALSISVSRREFRILVLFMCMSNRRYNIAIDINL